ncbi:MAG: hypothetical protein FD172_4041 [Methylocystaceae bacterium]|nr:MAG: hypothetical protein FD172_4041 [Methylocystaceae bacterium]
MSEVRFAATRQYLFPRRVAQRDRSLKILALRLDRSPDLRGDVAAPEQPEIAAQNRTRAAYCDRNDGKPQLRGGQEGADVKLQ